eukprot:TRINITY_DN49430_c0_g1_i1.p1 TRINITY_DN49430_c0_g1~~TRINITY_DN49430_c0_g1_i1.p1  ORF type:complete len:463 (-),score=36.90 TRINITY_DN49430_c0_g1_i1:115-1503(-)
MQRWLIALVAVHVVLASTSVNASINEILTARGSVGLAAWSVEGATGHLCTDGVAGVRINGEPRPLVLTGNTRFHIGSCTKSMTATLLAILIEDGSIPGWDAALGALLPDLAAGTAYENVTLTQLLGMLSGLAPNPPSWWVYQQQHPNDIIAQRAACTADALASAPQVSPGTAYLYSNWAYLVAGHIIERLSGSSWEELMRVRLFAPLGVHLDEDAAAWTGAPSGPWDPWGHNGDVQTPCNPATSTWGCDNPPILGPAGTFSGPAAATSAYFAWHLRCHNGVLAAAEASPLPQAACRALHKPADSSLSDYGFGWTCVARTWAGGDDSLACTHDGSNTINYFVAWLGFGIDRAFLAFTNGAGRSDGADAAMTDAAIGALIGAMDSEDCTQGISPTVAPMSSSTSGPTGTPADVPTGTLTNVPIGEPTGAPTTSQVASTMRQARLAVLFLIFTSFFDFGSLHVYF